MRKAEPIKGGTRVGNLLYIIWQKENEVGIPIIDEQHRGLIASINSLHYFIQEGEGAEVLKPTLQTLMQYTNIHFRTEEALMKRAGYPEFDSHVLLHEKLIEQTKSTAYECLSSSDAEPALRFLKEWWLNHINNTDRQYAPYLKRALGIT
ncbi:MAG TPA: bacteriohemerythrin [Deltaproteobacteria bacterium]|nr:bacteriohemerythrin [Deltaproteobacteria bacterium]HOI06720.1 bacteriohemerythrin [Deltaproteobacteria bacterium]